MLRNWGFLLRVFIELKIVNKYMSEFGSIYFSFRCLYFYWYLDCNFMKDIKLELRYYWIFDLKKLCEIINVFCFNFLCFGVICYVVMGNWYREGCDWVWGLVNRSYIGWELNFYFVMREKEKVDFV